MESWRQVWRDGFAKVLPVAALVALRDGLRSDDKRLIQGATTTPPPLMCVADWPCEAGCLLSFAGWIGTGLRTVGQVEQFFAEMCQRTDELLGDPAACRWLLNWYDDTPRDDMRRELLAEVERSLAERLPATAAA